MIPQTGPRFTVNSRKYDGSVRRSWMCELIRRDADKLDLIGSFEIAVEHPDLGVIEAGTVSHERFYLNRWYNYFLFQQPNGDFRNYYINICMPPTIGEGVVDYVDLDIDIIVWPDGRFQELDLDEFEVNAYAYGYPAEVRENALKTLDEVRTLLATDSDVCRAVARL